MGSEATSVGAGLGTPENCMITVGDRPRISALSVRSRGIRRWQRTGYGQRTGQSLGGALAALPYVLALLAHQFHGVGAVQAYPLTHVPDREPGEIRRVSKLQPQMVSGMPR